MGRLETKWRVSPTSFFLLLLLVVWQDLVLATAIFPLDSDSRIGASAFSSSSWDFDNSDIETSDGEYATFFSDVNLLSSKEADDTNSSSDIETNRKRTKFGTLKSDSFPTSRAEDGDWYTDSELTDSFKLPPNQTHSRKEFFPLSTRPFALATLKDTYTNLSNQSHRDKSTKMDQLKSQFEKEKIVTKTQTSYSSHSVSAPNHGANHNSHSVGVGDATSNDVKTVQAKMRRYFSSNHMEKESDSDKTTDSNNAKTTTTMDSSSANIAPLLISKAVKNQNRNGKNISSQQNTSSLQFKFPYRIPFPYVRRRSNEDEYKRASKASENINEKKSSSGHSQRYYNINGDMRLQRKNRSKRNTLQNPVAESNGVVEEERGTVRMREDDYSETRDIFRWNQQHKSSEDATGSVVGNNSVRADEVAETNVRHNATSRPPPPTNPVVVLQRLTHLLDKMLRELSTFGQKFTLRLIRMTERHDIDQMQEIMKDFDISPEKPIFFIAGGLRKLKGSAAVRVLPSPIAPTPNLTENVAIVLNVTAIDEPSTELPILNSTEEDHAILDGTTMVPILRPSGISSLPVEPDTDDNIEETTLAPPEQESDLEIPGSYNTDSNSTAVDSINVTSVHISLEQPLARRKRAIPQVDEFIFHPIPGRSARTENPYDDEDEEEFDQIYNYAQANESEDESWYNENAKHLASVVPVNPGITTSSAPSLSNIPDVTAVIDQSQMKKNDEISLNDSNAISSNASPRSSESTSSLHSGATVTSGSSSDSSPLILLDRTKEGIIPPSDSIKIKEQVMENGGSNDHSHHRQGEQSILHEIQTNNVSVLRENNKSHVEEHRPKEKLLKADVTDQKDDDDLQLFTSRKTLEKSNPISSPVDESLKADEKLSLVHEIFTEKERKVALDIERNKLEMNKPTSSFTTPQLETASGSLQQLLENKKVGNESKAVIPTRPSLILQTEDRSFHTGFNVERSKQNIAQKAPLHKVILTKEGEQVETGNRQLLSSELSTDLDSDAVISSFNYDTVSENEGNTPLPPTHSSPAVEPVSVTDNVSSVPFVSSLNEVNVAPVKDDNISAKSTEMHASSLEDRNAISEAPHRENVISMLQESNQNDPQEDMKAEVLLPQANIILPESGINIPAGLVGVNGIKENRPKNVEKVSLTSVSEQVPMLYIQQHTELLKPTASKENTKVEAAVLTQVDPTRVDPLQSTVAPYSIKTGESNTLVVAATESIGSPTIVLNRENSGNEEQTRNKHQSFTLGKNQATLVGQQNVVDMKKVVKDEKGDEIGREKIQVSPNQQNFYAPTVLKESQIIGNNTATFLPADKASPVPTNIIPIHSLDHVVVRGTGTVDLSGTAFTQATDKIDSTVRNTDQVVVRNSKNSDASGTEENKNGSNVAPVVSDNGEVKNSVVTSVSSVVAPKKVNVDALSVSAGKENSSPVLTSQEPSNVVNSMLSSDITLPFTESLEKHVTEDRLNVGSSPEIAPSIVLTLVSPNMNDEVEKVSSPENENLNLGLNQETKQPNITETPTVKVVNDLSKIIQDVLKIGKTKIESVLADTTNSDTSATASVEKNVLGKEPIVSPQFTNITHVEVGKDYGPESVKIVPGENMQESPVAPAAQVVPDPLLIDKVIKIAQGNTEVVGSNKKKIVEPIKILPTNLEGVKGEPHLVTIPETDELMIANENLDSIKAENVSTEAIPVYSESLVAPVLNPTPVASMDSTSVVKEIPEAIIPESMAVSVLKQTSQAAIPEEPLPTTILIQAPSETIIPAPLQKQASKPEPVVPDPLGNLVFKGTTVSAVDPVSTKMTPSALIPDLPVATVLKPAEVTIGVGSLADPVLKGVHELKPLPILPNEDLTQLSEVVKPAALENVATKPEQEHILSPTALVKPFASMSSVLIDSSAQQVPGNDNIIAGLPEIDPDSAFVVKPIDTQPHFQIPGLRPSIPERPHPDYLDFISQGVDVDSLVFSTPNTPIVVASPPVFSGYSPAAIVRKQEQMMKNYFNGLFVRRALPI